MSYRVKQVRDSEISYGITYVKNLMNFLQNKSRLTSLENELMVHEGKGIIREFGLTCTLLYLKWVTNKDPVYGTENSAQHYVITT